MSRNSLVIPLLLLSVFLAPGLPAQTPAVTNGLPGTSFPGEQLCFDADLTNVGGPGFGPYLRLILPPEMMFDSATFMGSGVTTINVGTFPGSGMLTDPRTGDVVSGPIGGSLTLLIYPIGSVVAGGPILTQNICATIYSATDIAVILDVTLQPVYEFGDTATGINGRIEGSANTASVQTTLFVISKMNDAPEGENPPSDGSSYVNTYMVTTDVANSKTVFDAVFTDTLDAGVQYDGNLIITGGTNCLATIEPSLAAPGGTLVITCDSITGSLSSTDVFFSYDTHITDILDETTCGTTTVTNSLSLDLEFPDNTPLPTVYDSSDISAEHVVLRKAAWPGPGVPGDTITFTTIFAVTSFDDATALEIVAILPDGYTFGAHQSMTVNSAGETITPNVSVDALGVTTITYDVTAVTGTLPFNSTGEIVYTATIDQLYTATGDPVLAADSLVTTANSTWSLDDGAVNCSDGTGATVTISPVTISKEIVNLQSEYLPGETVTFRLSLYIPSGDTAAITFQDFFPLPIFDVSSLDLTYGNDIREDFANDTIGLTPTSIAIDAGTNSLTIDWPDVNTTAPQTIAILIDMTVAEDPFADKLFLTNLFQATTANTAGNPALGTTPVTLTVFAPVLELTKGVYSSDNATANATISPSPLILPVDGDISSSDAGDTITYVLTVDNTGGATAFDVVITDPAVTELTGLTLVSVLNDKGRAIGTTGTLDTGLSLDESIPPNRDFFLEASESVSIFTDGGGAGVVDAGDTLQYTIEILNVDGAITGAVVNITVPSDTTYVGGSLATDVGSVDDFGDPSLLAILGSMPAGDSATVIYRVTVDAVANGTIITAQSTVNSDQTQAESTDSDNDDSDGDQALSVTTGSAVPAAAAAPVLSSERVLVTATYTLNSAVEPGQAITNTASAVWASGTGEVTFPAVSDDANVTVASPAILKSVTAITPGYAGNLSEASIGEVITYSIVVTVPEGVSGNVTFTDLLDDGLAFTDVVSIVASSGDLSTSIGTFANVLAGAVITNQGAGGHQLDRALNLDFGTVTNANSNDGSAETITIVTRARVLNWTGNTRGAGRNNSASWIWDNPNGPGQLTVSDNAANVTIVEPGLTITKTLSAASADAGDTLTVTIDIAHSGSSDADAHDVTLTDVLPTGFTFAAAGATAGVAPTTGPAHAGGQVNAVWDTLALGQTAQVNFTVTVDNTVSPEEVIQNTGSLEWESLQTADEASLPAPLNNTLGVERTGSFFDPGTTANIYSASNSDSITVPDGAVAKSIDSVTPGGASPEITTGDTVVYEMTITLPEGTTSSLLVVDDLPAGLDYQGAALDTAGFLGAVGISTAGVTGGSPATGQEVTVTFNASTTVTGSAGTANNSFNLRITADVVDNAANDGLPAVQDKTNTATLSYTGSTGPYTDTASTDFAEPELAITKTMSPATNLDAGDTVTVTLTVNNTGTAPAYDIVVTDVLNDTDALFDTSSALEITTPAGYTYGFADPTVTWTADAATALDAGMSAVFAFTATVSGAVLTGSTLDNLAAVAGDSQDGPVTNERTNNDTGGDSVTTGAVTVSKTLTASTEAWTSDTAPIEMAIGEIASFRLVFGLPEGFTAEDTAANAIISDTLPSGHGFIAGSAQIQAVTDSGISGSVYGALPTSATAIAPTVNGQDLEFDLGSLQNDDDDAGVEQVIISYDVLVGNDAGNNRTDGKSNSGVLRFLNTDGMGQSITDMVDWTIAEPNLALIKDAAPATVIGGSTVTFTVVLTNTAGTNVTRAWEPLIVDTLPARYQAPFAITSVTHSSQGLLATSGNFAGNVLTVDPSNDLAAADNYLGAGETLTVIYTADIDPAISFEEDVTNTVDATASSLPGDNGTGSTTPGSPGDSDGERTGSGVGENDLSATATATVTAGRPTITKVAASDTLQILETTTVTLSVDVPVGTTNTFVITDDLPAGLSYTGTAIVITTPATDFTSTLTPGSTPGAGADPLVFDFGNITNSSAGAQQINITYEVEPGNILGNQNTTALTNTATVTYAGASMPFPSVSETITVIEANLELTKTIAAGATGSDAGDTISFQLEVSNTAGIATAHRVDLSDVLPAHLLGGTPTFNITSLDDDGGAVVQTGGGAVTAGTAVISTTTNADDTLGWPLLEIPAGSTLTITYDAVLTADSVAGENLSNTAVVAYDSLPAGGGRNNSDSNDDDDGNLDNYGEVDTAVVTVDSAIAVQKTLNASHGGNNDFTIGDLVTFDLRVDLIEGISGNVNVTDTLPAGLTFVGPARIIAGGHVSYDGTPNLNTLSYDLGAVTNSADGIGANDFFIIEVDARLDDAAGNVAGVMLSNSVSLTADVGPAGPDTQMIDLIEPNLVLTKVPDNTILSWDDTVTFTITVSHSSSTADAFDVVLTDAIPAGLTYVLGSHSGDGSVNEAVPGVPVFSLGSITLVDMNKSFSFDCTVDNGATLGVPITNIINLVYDSQSGTPTVERAYSTSASSSVTPTTVPVELMSFSVE